MVYRYFVSDSKSTNVIRYSGIWVKLGRYFSVCHFTRIRLIGEFTALRFHALSLTMYISNENWKKHAP